MSDNEKKHENARHNKQDAKIGRKTQIAVLVLFSSIAVLSIGLAVWSVLTVSGESNPGQERGVGADGFSAFVEKDGNLGVALVASKDQAVSALGDKAEVVEAGRVSKVFNLNGNLGQTITFPFVRADKENSSIYIDKRIYKSAQALRDDNIYQRTLSAGEINGHPLYYRAAQTIGPNREYHVMIVDGTTVYRYVLAQPFKNVSISEVEALAILKRLATVANL